MPARLSAIIALLMLGVYYLVALAGPPALVAAFLLDAHEYDDLRPWLAVGGIVATAFVLVPILIPFRVEPEPGVPVDRDSEPGLWRMVAEVAAATGSRPPHKLLLTPFPRVSASEETAVLGFAGRGRRLYLGLPLIEMLPVDHLRALTAHELGHHAHGHTRLIAIVRRGLESLRRSSRIFARLARAGKYSLLFWPAWFVLLLFEFAYQAVAIVAMRHQEYEADREMVKIRGRAGAAVALRGSVLAAKAWNECWERYVEPAVMCGRAPEDLYGNLRRLLADPALTVWRAMTRYAPPDDKQQYLDPYPPLAARLEAIGRCPETAVTESRTGLAVTLLADPPRARRAVEKLLFGSMRTLQWADPGVLAAVHESVTQGLMLQALVRRTAGTSRPTLAFVLTTLNKELGPSSGRLQETNGPTTLVAEHLCALVTCAFISGGGARYERVDGVVELVDRDGERVPVAERVRTALARRDVTSLRPWLRERDVPLGFELRPRKLPFA